MSDIDRKIALLSAKEKQALLSFAGCGAADRATLDSLVQVGFVKSEPDELEGRRTAAYGLTPEGSALIPKLLAASGYL